VEPEGEPEVVQEATAEEAMIAVRTAVSRRRLVVLVHHFRRCPTGLQLRGLPSATEWRWSWGIPPLTRRVTSP
jgi:hypothetical protein